MVRFKNILVVVDAASESHSELERAMKLVDQTSDAHLHVIDIAKSRSFLQRLLQQDYGHVHAAIIEEKQNSLDELVKRCKSHGIEASGEILEGPSSGMTIRRANELRVDMIVRSNKGVKSLEIGPLGSTSQKLMRAAPCSIWLTSPAHELELKTIVAAVDATPHDSAHAQLNSQILQTATDIAKRERCKLIVAYAWSIQHLTLMRRHLTQEQLRSLEDGNRAQHRESFEKLLSAYDLHATGPDSRMVLGDASSEIPQICEKENADLLVCGRIARPGLGAFLGSTAERIVNRTTCSVLAIALDNENEF